MKRTPHRLLLLALATGAVISCDTRLPTASRRAAPGTPPSVVIDSPVVNSQINLGDSILVRAQVTGGNGLVKLVMRADKLTGDKDLGTFEQIPRFTTVTTDFPPGTTDTVIRRYLRVLNPADESLDTLVIIAIVTDSLGLADTSLVNATIVSGPHVVIESPVANDSVPAGVGISISAHATDVDGIGRITIRVTGDPSWPTKLDDTVSQVYDGSSRDVTLTTVINIPADAPPRSRLTVNASAIDAVRQPGSAPPIGLFIRSNASIPAPRVTQVVPPRAERGDTILITATGQGIVSVGLVVRDEFGALISQDTTLLPPPITSNVHMGILLKLPLAQQGKHLAITAFAIDQLGRIGFAVRTTVAGSETNLANALVDSTEIVYGQTYTMPLAGTIGDVTVDVPHGNIFMSNTKNNRLEVFANQPRTFAPNGIPVGSLPWGMTMAAPQTPNSGDTLLVANSGGTNISRVCINVAACPGGIMREDLANRMLTRNIFVFIVIESRDANTGKVTLSVTDPISYSDRPQYIAQASTGRIYFSTRPTPSAADGTVRWLDPDKAYPAPDPHLIYQYGNFENSTIFKYVIFNVDSVKINAAQVNSPASDGLLIWDHPYGQTSGVICVNAPARVVGGVTLTPACPKATLNGQPEGPGNPQDFSVNAALTTLAAQATCSFPVTPAFPCPTPFFASDLEAVMRLDPISIGLTDTTFVASSVDRNWIAFGEGNTGRPGRVMMTNDHLVGGLPPFMPQFFSPLVTVKDLTDNAAERVFGLALDLHGKTIASHGLQSYLSEVDDPFHLRLQGKYDSKDNGAGIALHPDADGRNSPASQRLAFVAAATGSIEIVDIAYFINRGSLQLKYPVYGPLRVSQPMVGDNTGLTCPGDPSCVVLKLFALTTRGLIVVDLTALDIKPGPP